MTKLAFGMQISQPSIYKHVTLLGTHTRIHTPCYKQSISNLYCSNIKVCTHYTRHVIVSLVHAKKAQINVKLVKSNGSSEPFDLYSYYILYSYMENYLELVTLYFITLKIARYRFEHFVLSIRRFSNFLISSLYDLGQSFCYIRMQSSCTIEVDSAHNRYFFGRAAPLLATLC